MNPQIIITILFTFIAMTGMSQTFTPVVEDSVDFVITGTTPSTEDSVAAFSLIPHGPTVKFPIYDGKFMVTGRLPRHTFFQIGDYAENDLRFIVEEIPTHINLATGEVTGSDLQRRFIRCQMREREKEKTVDSWWQGFNQDEQDRIMSMRLGETKIQTAHDSAIINQFNDYIAEQMAVRIQNIRENIDNIIPIWYLYGDIYSMTPELIDEFMREDASYAHHPAMERPWRYYRGLQEQNTIVGKPSIDFEAEAPDGTKHRLSEYVGHGQYVLLDFWASWCGPCIASFPLMRQMYDTYKDRGLRIIGVSCDKDRTAWLKALDKHQLPWTALRSPSSKGNANDLYGANTIPTIILISPDGKILSTNLEGMALRAKLAEIFDSSFFQTDSALIRGRIVDYSSTMGFLNLSAQIDDLFMSEHKVVSAEIHEDGTFEKRLLLHHPIFNWFFTSTDKIGKKEIPFYLCPGDTLNITISFNGKDIPDCTYSGGHADDVARLLQVRTEYLDTYGQCLSFAGDIPAYNHWADSVYTECLHEVEKCATEHDFTPFERHLMLCDVSANFGTAYLSYFSQMKTRALQEDPSAEMKAGNAVMENLSQPNHYEVLRRLPNDDPLMMASMYYPLYMNRLEFAAPLHYPLMIKRGGLSDDNKEEVEADLSFFRDQGRQLFAADQDVLPIHLLQLQRINDALGTWMETGEAEENFNALLSYVSHPQIKEIAKQCFHELMSMGFAYPLPEDPAADFVRKILAKHPGRYIVLDFWAMWCAPCKKEIMDTKNFRQQLHERSDIQFVFLANETHPERKEYQDFVSTNLDGECNIVIDDNRFRQMQDLFGFNAIPFNVTLTPDGYIVTEGLLLRSAEAGYDVFIQQLEEIKQICEQQ